ncbi:MAG: protein kinase domain-containing protein [Gemmatimonadales bacterium]
MSSTLAHALRDRYVIDRELGRGGMATVYLAHDLKHDRPVALKVLHPELAAALGSERFLREIRTAARLQHPHILSLHDSGEVAGHLWFTMPFVEGESLRERLRREVQLPVEEAIRLSCEVADALDYAHSKEVVHRDVKPENILLSRGHALVADFGVAKAIAADGGQLTETGMAVGTAAYMSPEQATGGRVDVRTDVYALGCVLYEMLAGQPPYSGPTAQALIGQTIGAPIPSVRHLRPDVPARVDRIIRKALAKAAAGRFASTRDLASALGVSGHRHANVFGTIGAAAALLAVIAVGWVAGRHHASAGDVLPSLPSPRSVAVLPFQSLSVDSSDAYFATGISEDVSSQLAGLSGIRVVAHTSARAVAMRTTEPREIGAALGVAALLEGSVRRAADQIRVTARLVDARTGAQLWTEDYDRTLRNVLGIQREIAEHIAAALNATLTPGEKAGLGERRTVDPEAYRLYLLGRHHFARYTPPAMRRSIAYFEQAIARDSGFAPAYAALADAQVFLVLWGRARPNDLMPAARAAAARALRVDSTLGDAHTALGLIAAAYDWDWGAAEARFRRAIALSPNSAFAYMWYGSFVLSPLGRYDEALAQLRRAQELDPVSLPVRYNLGARYYDARRFKDAVVEFQRALELDPGFAPARTWLGFAYAGLGRYDDAIHQMEQAVPDSAMTSNAVLGAVYAWAGQRDRARVILRSLVARAGREYVHPMDFSLLYAALGQRDEAFRWLRRAYEERSFLLIWINVATWYDGIRDDPRFAVLVRDVGLVPSTKP